MHLLWVSVYMHARMHLGIHALLCMYPYQCTLHINGTGKLFSIRECFKGVCICKGAVYVPCTFVHVCILVYLKMYYLKIAIDTYEMKILWFWLSLEKDSNLLEHYTLLPLKTFHFVFKTFYLLQSQSVGFSVYYLLNRNKLKLLLVKFI